MLATKGKDYSMISTVFVLAAALAAQSPSAETPAAPAPAQNTVESGDKIVCKRVPIRGSRFSKRVCATAVQWEEQRRRNIEITREFQRSDGSSKAGT